MRRRVVLYLLYPFIGAFYLATGQRNLLRAFRYLLTTRASPITRPAGVMEPRAPVIEVPA